MPLNKLPDIGTLSYGTIFFDVLKHTKISSRPVEDSANRTVKYVTHTLTVEGVVVLPDKVGADQTIDTIWVSLRQELETNGLPLVYTGRGFGDIRVNVGGLKGTAVRDVNWGPKPKILDFVPLGQGRSASITWQVEFSIPECECAHYAGVCEYTFETNLSYDEDFYANIVISGTLEIALTWQTGVNRRKLADIVDAYRKTWLDNPPAIDDFKVKDRSFKESKDKRHMDWSYTYEEMAPMGPPFHSSKANGTYSVRPKSGKSAALTVWMATLRCRYVVRKSFPRRSAYLSFLTILQDRISASRFGFIPPGNNPGAQPQQQANRRIPNIAFNPNIPNPQDPTSAYSALYRRPIPADRSHAVILWNFGMEEGIYDDSKSVSFEASWQFSTTLRSLMQASGAWQMVTHDPALNTDNPLDASKTLWRRTMQDVTGWTGNQALPQSPKNDLVIDLCVCDMPTKQGTGALGIAKRGGPPLPLPVNRSE